MLGSNAKSKKDKKALELTATYVLTDKKRETTVQGQAKTVLKKKSLSILPENGEAIFLSFRDILDFSAGDYKMKLFLTSNETLTLSDLGYQYEDFLRVFSKLRNEMVLKDMLMHESLKKSGIKAGFDYFSEKETQKGNCEIKLYETALVILPEKGELIRIPYSDITESKEEDYRTVIGTELGTKLVLAKMGEKYDLFKRTLSKSQNELSLKVQSTLKELAPSADPLVIRKASRLMKEGKAARRSDIESISPLLWKELEKKLEAMGIKEEYDFLTSLAQKEKVCIGLKRGLMGGLTGEYIWFLIPIYSADPKAPGNAVAMEATSEEESGKATYFFRIVSRKDYSSFKEINDLRKTVDDFIEKINRAMIEINFRREPIFLPDEKLEEPKYAGYKFAIKKLPALETLRSLFIGRVIHSSEEQWKDDVMDLLKFNVSTQDDSAKWEKEEDSEA